MPEPDELPAEVGHIRLGAAARGVHPLEIHGQSHVHAPLTVVCAVTPGAERDDSRLPARPSQSEPPPIPRPEP